ncbi:MAG: VIT domain-containing protein [Sandaracinaceae bacterium]
MRNLAVAFVSLFVPALLACGGEVEVQPTVATLTPVRGTVQIRGQEPRGTSRVEPNTSIELAAGALARLDLDVGARVLLGEGALSVDASQRLAVEAGRAFVETRGEPVQLRAGEVSLQTRDAGFSVSRLDGAVSVYVVRGEVGWAGGGDAAGVIGPGEQVDIQGGEARARPLALWEDWTHGWAEAGPADATRPVGVGSLEGRVPEEVGRARWPLVVRRLDVRVRIVRDLAITEIDQVFFNPASESLEGLYRVQVPEGAILSRFAVDREGRLVDGYVRERAQAERAYTQQVYRGSTLDPALLEWDGPGAYRARIYPIGAGETRRVVVRYAEWLGGEGARLYRYPMGAERAPRIQELSIDVDLSEADVTHVRAGLGAAMEEGALRLRLSDVVPRSDFWVELEPEDEAPSVTRAWRSPHVEPVRAPGTRASDDANGERDYWLLPLVLPASLVPASAPAGLDVVVVSDLSAATDRGGLELGRAVVEALGNSLSPEDRVAVVGADLELRPVPGATSTLGPATPDRITALLDGIARMRPSGASDLGASLVAAAGLLEPGRPGVLVYVGDGHVSVGERTGADLAERLARLPEPARLYAVGAGADADLGALRDVTRGGGLSIAVEEHRQGTDAALAILAHARRPVAHRVTLDTGDHVEAVFPRGPVDLVVGDLLTIGGRLTGDPPSEVRVRAVIAGQPVETTLSLETEEAPDGTDLRLRWASARLSNLMLDGASREEVVELGVRHGLITPHTSFYVPSAAELRRMGILATRLMDRPSVNRMALRTEPVSPLARGALAVVMAPLTLSGCGELSDRAEEIAGGGFDGQHAPDSPAPMEPTSSSNAADPSAPPPAEAPPATTPPIVPAEATPEPEPSPDITAVPPRPTRRRPRGRRSGRLDLDSVQQNEPATGAADIRRRLSSLRGPAQRCFRRAASRNPGLVGGRLQVRVTVGTDGRVSAAQIANSTMSDPSVAACVLSLLRQQRFAPRPSPVTVTVPFVFAASGPNLILTQLQTARILVELTRAGIQADAHTARPCSDAAELPLAERRELWRERLRAGQAWPLVRALAITDCEARSWRERRALVQEILRHASNVGAMLAVVNQLGTDAERSYARRLALARVRTPADVRAVRAAFGDEVGEGLIEQVLDEARTPETKVRALRALSQQYPHSFTLRLALVSALDAVGRQAEAGRLAERMRADPVADMGVRTAIGERLVALGQSDEARRAFSEIVEFAPLDELARRRLGDLYRAHGWYDLAYRQYETLRSLRPDDPGVLLLLARAAAGAGRVDEALRLEARVRETQGDGALGRVATLWTSARYAQLMHAASGDADRTEALSRRRRRSGVLSHASALRVSLTFAHPDAQLALWVGMPGYRPSRPTDISPQHGLEVFDLAEQEAGAYRIEVRRTSDGSALAAEAAPVEAVLVVVWDEGRSTEQIRVFPLRFDAGQEARAWSLSGRAITADR